MFIVLFFTLLLTGECLSQCFTGADYAGSVVSAVDIRTCCVETSDGLSFNDGMSCRLCIGMSLQTIVKTDE